MSEPLPQHDLDEIRRINREIDYTIAGFILQQINDEILKETSNGQNNSSTEDR